MKGQRQRLRTVELSLTPHEVVLLWMKNSLTGTYEEGALQSPRPRGAIANSIATIVRNSLKGEPDVVVERAILQARQEADGLYMIVVEVNARVHQQFFERMREHVFLCAYLLSVRRCPISSISEELLRRITLGFVNEILLLEGMVYRISAERFGGQAILFSDSVARLKEQVELADEALEIFNFLAREAQFRQLSKEEICESLVGEIDQQVSGMAHLAHTTMLAAFGEERGFRAALATKFEGKNRSLRRINP